MISPRISPSILKSLNVKSKSITKTKKNASAKSLIKKLSKLSLQTPDLKNSCKLNKMDENTEFICGSNGSLSTTASEMGSPFWPCDL